MPLTEFQESIARLLSINRTEDSYLAGGAAIHIAANSTRYSNDLDYFNDSEERVASAFRDDTATLESADCTVNVLLQQPGFIRAVVQKGDASIKVEWAHDTAWRFMPVQQSETTGYLLHPVDLAINKLLALVGRDEIRDYIDIHGIMENTLPLGALCWAAAGKDPGFTPGMLLDLLRRRGKYRPEDLMRLDLAEPQSLTDLKKKWLKALDDADAFIHRSDPELVGCLFYSTKKDRFVQPEPDEEVQPHYGRPGGVLPLIKD